MKLTSMPRVRFGAVAALGLALILSIVVIVAMAAHPSRERPTDLGANLVKQRTYPSLSYGIQTFLWWNEVLRQADLERVRQMRFGYVKQIFGWNDVEPDPALPDNWQQADAVVDEVQYRQLKLIVRISKWPEWAVLKPSNDPADPPFDLKAFGTYCGRLAARYKGKIAGYQVWNEPNLSREWADRSPNAAAYVKLLAACHKAIKAADPNAVVISSGLAPTNTYTPQVTPDEMFLTEMYRAGAAQYYDVLGVHAPGYKSPPDLSPDDPSLDHQRWQSFRHVEDMRAIMVANGDGAKQVAVLEFGWTTDTRDTVMDHGTAVPNDYRWFAVSEQKQAEYLVGAYRYAAQHWRPWIGLMLMIYLPDPNWTKDREEYWWAITEPGYAPRIKPAFIDLANMAHYIDDQFIPAIDPGDNSYTPMPPRTPKK